MARGYANPLTPRRCSCCSVFKYFFPKMNNVPCEWSMKTCSFSPFTRTPGHRTRQLHWSPVTSKPSSSTSALNPFPTTSLLGYARGNTSPEKDSQLLNKSTMYQLGQVESQSN